MATPSTSLSQQQVSNVPNPGNDLSAIAQLAPGVIMNTQGGYGNVEAFGLPATSNLFTMDGMDDNDPFLNLNNSGATNLLLGSNEIQEADVVIERLSHGSFGTFSGMQCQLHHQVGRQPISRQCGLLLERQRDECQRLVQQRNTAPSRSHSATPTSGRHPSADRSRRTSCSSS